MRPRMRIIQRKAGTYTLLLEREGTTEIWRAGIASKAEAGHRARVVADMCGYDVQRFRPQRPEESPKEGTMTSTTSIEKGAAVVIDAEQLKEKRRAQLAALLAKPGRVTRILNGRAFVDFGEGKANVDMFWLGLNQLRPASAEEAKQAPAVRGRAKKADAAVKRAVGARTKKPAIEESASVTVQPDPKPAKKAKAKAATKKDAKPAVEA